MKRFRVLCAKLFLFQLVLALMFGLVELGARLWLEHGASEAQFNRFASIGQHSRRFASNEDIRFAPHRYVGYMPRPGFDKGVNKHNALGYREPDFELPKPEGEFRIVCLGGSTTYTTSVVDDKVTYPAQIERMLNERGYPHVKVINSGCAAWSSYESLINFQFRVLDLDPDLIIVYHAVNDIHTRVVWPTEAYRGDNRGRRDAVPGSVYTPEPYEYSTLLRMLAVSSGRAEPQTYKAPDRMLYTEGPKSFHAHRFFSQWERGVYPTGVFKQVPVQKMLDAHPPVYFERNLASIIAVARAHGVGVMMGTFSHSPMFEKEARAASEDYNRAFPEMIASMKKVCAENDVPCFDFAAVFPRDKEFFADGRHVNGKGSMLKARLFARFLLDNDLVPGGPTGGNGKRNGNGNRGAAGNGGTDRPGDGGGR